MIGLICLKKAEYGINKMRWIVESVIEVILWIGVVIMFFKIGKISNIDSNIAFILGLLILLLYFLMRKDRNI